MRAAWALVVLVCSVAAAQSDGGGRDVSIAMFSTHAVKAVTISAAGEGAWVASCAACVHKPLTVPLQFAAGEVFAGGPVKVSEDGSQQSRTATGLWHLRGKAGEVDVVLTLPSERYVAAVVQGEASPGEKQQALEALAIVARTYALNGRHWKPRTGHLPAELCDSTQCMAMRLGRVPAAMEIAVRNTAGETIWFRGRRAEVFFSQHCGGETESAAAVWPTLRGATYLAAHPDAFCVRKDKAAWHAEIPLAEFAAMAREEGWRMPARITAVEVTKRSPSHRALQLAVVGEDGARFPVAASSLRLAIGRAMGWNQVRSDLYDVAVRNGAIVFDGRGHGHGVGLCQAGTNVMASDGKTSREIVGYYFAGVSMGITPKDAGWQASSLGALQVRSVGKDTAREAAIARAWNEAAKRFPLQHEKKAEIVAAPTVEIFRQMTSEPGWMLAATRGSTVVLQPWSVLGAQADSVLLHEMLHLRVESEAGAKAPLWLREGLVEFLADGAHGGSQMNTAAVEAALGHPANQRENQQAHLAAGAKVRDLVRRYGLAAMRGWLVSGVPAGVA